MPEAVEQLAFALGGAPSAVEVADLPRAYFVCIGNAGRSQMAQALYERRGGEARSAGSQPEDELHPQVVEAMREVGIDISARRPKGITPEDVEWADVVVTMGCGDACPVLPGSGTWTGTCPIRSVRRSKRFARSATTSTAGSPGSRSRERRPPARRKSFSRARVKHQFPRGPSAPCPRF